MRTNALDAALRARCNSSLDRSQERRERAGRLRRRRLRARGGVLSLAAMALCVAVAGAGLATAASVKTAGSVPAIGKGDRGPSVVKLQKKLGVRADGFFGSQTERAVQRFQRERGLPADGVVGPDTARALRLGALRTANGTTGGSGGSGAQDDDGGSERRSRRVSLPAELVRIAQCESGGNPRAVSRSGQYRGKFQFDVGTWRGLGGRGDPAKAPEWLQDRLALKLYRRSGSAPWGACA